MLNKLSKSHQTFAFISYARCDSWWEARRLQHLLESYKIPRSLAPKDIRLPDGKYLRKVFVDTSDLPVSNGDFREDIKRELDAAEYLVVLCSQGSARPESYVHEEIRYFAGKPNGGYGKILPVVLDGFNAIPEELSEIIKSRNVVVWDRATRAQSGRRAQDENIVRFKVVGFMLHVKSEILNNRYWAEWKRWASRVGLVVFSGLVSLIALLCYGLAKSHEALRQQAERTKFEKRVFPRSIDFSYMTAFAKPLIRSCTNDTCVVIAAMPANYAELANDPKKREMSILADAAAQGWTNCTKRIQVTEKKRGIGVIELHNEKASIRGARVYLDTVNQMSSVREVVNYLTTDSPYYTKEQRELLTEEYVSEFEKCLEVFLAGDDELRNRIWEFHFVTDKQSLKKALDDVCRRFRKGCEQMPVLPHA